MVEVIGAPGTLQDWAKIEERLRLLEGHVQWVQIDFADNTLVPNKTFMEFAPFKAYAEKFSLEAHFMVANPEKYIKSAVDAGFKRLIAHIEAHDPRLFIEQCMHENVEIGIAIDGPTDFEQLEPFLEEVDFVLVMTIEAGFSGSKFMPETVDKIKSLHNYLPDLPIEVDGGITDQTARLVKDAGATRLVSTSYLFQDPANIEHAIETLKNE